MAYPEPWNEQSETDTEADRHPKHRARTISGS